MLLAAMHAIHTFCSMLFAKSQCALSHVVEERTSSVIITMSLGKIISDIQSMLTPLNIAIYQMLQTPSMPQSPPSAPTKEAYILFQTWPISLFAASLTYEAVAPTGLFRSLSSTDPELYARNAE
jgi:hypothetical protein